MVDRVYEMLWNCTACGTNALLGKSQRRCPNCGSPQDESKRYFPKAGEEVAVDGHRFEGADWTCGACTTPNGAAAAFCQNCGNGKDGNKSAALQADRIVKDGALVDNQAPAPAPAQPSRSKMPLVLGGVAVVVCLVVAVLVLVKKDVSVDVAGHVWTRTIGVERFEAVQESAWCDSMPGGAYNVSRSRQERSQRQVPNGEECHDRQKDQGDGTFKVSTECKPKYKSEPVYADKCSFAIDRWHRVREEVARGGLAQSPSWPALRLRGGSGLGAEREAGRAEAYTLQLRDPKTGKQHDCGYAEPRWRSVADGSRHSLQVRLLGGAVCDSLKP